MAALGGRSQFGHGLILAEKFGIRWRHFMADQVTILGIAGSLRKTSYNKGALRAAQKLCPAGARLDIYDIAGLPHYNQDEERNPTPKVIDLKQRIRAADAILIATPEYNYGIPGVLKNAIDCASRPYGDSAWNGMEAVLQPEVAIGNAGQRFDEQGNLTDDQSRQLISQLLGNLLDKARRMKLPLRAAT